MAKDTGLPWIALVLVGCASSFSGEKLQTFWWQQQSKSPVGAATISFELGSRHVNTSWQLPSHTVSAMA